MMVAVYAESWWAMVLRGIAAIVFGVLAFIWPHITLVVLVFLWGAYALVDGIFAVAAGIRSHGEYSRWWLLLIEGILGIIAGVVAFAIPAITAFVLLVLIRGLGPRVCETGHHGMRAAGPDRCLGHRDRHLRDRRRDSVAQTYSQRVAARTGGNSLDNLRCPVVHQSAGGSTRSDLDNRRVCDRVWRDLDRARHEVAQLRAPRRSYGAASGMRGTDANH